MAFGFTFNIPRWLEMTTKMEIFLEKNQTTTIVSLENTDLRKNPHYIRYYIAGLSSFINVFLPIAVLTFSILFFHKVIPSSHHRVMLLRILTINTSMFVMCHLIKVISWMRKMHGDMQLLVLKTRLKSALHARPRCARMEPPISGVLYWPQGPVPPLGPDLRGPILETLPSLLIIN